MRTMNVRQGILLLLLSLLIGCGETPAEETTQEERAEPAEIASVTPVVILVVDDFGQPPYQLAVGDLVAADVFQLQRAAVTEANFELAPNFRSEAAGVRGQFELIPSQGAGAAGTAVPAEEAAPAEEAVEVVAVPQLVGTDLVLDPVPFRLLTPLFTDTCVGTPDGQPHFASKGMAHVRAEGMAHVRAEGMAELIAGKPHGSLVYDQLRRSMEADGAVRVDGGLLGFDLFADKPWLRDIELWNSSDGHIVVAKVDTDGFSTELIAPRISEMIAIFSDGSSMQEINARWDTGDVYVEPARGAVVNMSFSLIPCDLSFGQSLADSEMMIAFRQSLPGALELAPQFAESAEDDLETVEGQSNDNVSAEAGQQLQNDLFYQLDSAPVMAQPEFRAAVIDRAYGTELSIADWAALRFLSDCDAADPSDEETDPLCRVLEGDYSIPVIPVAAAGNYNRDFPFFPAAWSSTVSIGATGADYSNRSEVTLDGDYELTLEDGSTEVVGGTSFAAPRFSYLAALYLLREGTDSCTENGRTTTPPLGYASSNGPWENRPLEQAADALCQRFLGGGEPPPSSAGEATFLDRAMAGDFAGGRVELLSLATGGEADQMTEILKPFEEGTGIEVDFVGSNDFYSEIDARVEAGDPPDIADLPGLNMLQRFAAGGHLVDLGDFLPASRLRQRYAQSWLDMTTVSSPQGPIIGGVWHRAFPNDLVWYSPTRFEEWGYEVPASWDEMLELTDRMAADGEAPWCIGIESGSATGWVATNWIEHIMLRTTSPDNYDRWQTGELPFASPEVTFAAELMSEIWFNDDYVYGGWGSIASTYFGDAPQPLFEEPPGCWLHLAGYWITGFFPEWAEPGVDYDFFHLPPIDPAYGQPAIVYGNVMAMFNDKPEARALMEYFSTAGSIEAWVRAGGAISPHLEADLDWYPYYLDQKAAETLTDATTIRPDASDLMPPEVGAGSFWALMTDYVAGAVDLDTALQEIDASWP